GEPGPPVDLLCLVRDLAQLQQRRGRQARGPVALEGTYPVGEKPLRRLHDRRPARGREGGGALLGLVHRPISCGPAPYSSQREISSTRSRASGAVSMPAYRNAPGWVTRGLPSSAAAARHGDPHQVARQEHLPVVAAPHLFQESRLVRQLVALGE